MHTLVGSCRGSSSSPGLGAAAGSPPGGNSLYAPGLLRLATALRETSVALLVLALALTGPTFKRLGADSPSPPKGRGSNLRIVTWNIANDLVETNQLESFLHTCDADVIAFQELSVGKAEWLAQTALDSYPHRALHGAGKDGLAVLSRFPIMESQLRTLQGEWPYLHARLQALEHTFTVLVTHPRAWLSALGTWQPAFEDFQTLAEIATQKAPSLLVGDFHTTERSAVYGKLTQAELLAAYRTHSQATGFTFPVMRRFHNLPSSPIARIDYILYTTDLTSTHCWIGEDAGSAHLPLFAELNFAE